MSKAIEHATTTDPTPINPPLADPLIEYVEPLGRLWRLSGEAGASDGECGERDAREIGGSAIEPASLQGIATALLMARGAGLLAFREHGGEPDGEDADWLIGRLNLIDAYLTRALHALARLGALPSPATRAYQTQDEANALRAAAKAGEPRALL